MRFSFPALVNGSVLRLMCVSDFSLYSAGSCLSICSVAAVQDESVIQTLTHMLSHIHTHALQRKRTLFWSCNLCSSCWMPFFPSGQLSIHRALSFSRLILYMYFHTNVFYFQSYMCLYSWANQFPLSWNASTTNFRADHLSLQAKNEILQCLRVYLEFRMS